MSDSKIYELLFPIAAVIGSAFRSESCEQVAKREIAKNSKELDAHHITLSQATGFLQTLQAMTHISGGTKCSSVVGFEYGMLLGRAALAKR